MGYGILGVKKGRIWEIGVKKSLVPCVTPSLTTPFHRPFSTGIIVTKARNILGMYPTNENILETMKTYTFFTKVTYVSFVSNLLGLLNGMFRPCCCGRKLYNLKIWFVSNVCLLWLLRQMSTVWNYFFSLCLIKGTSRCIEIEQHGF